MTLGRSSSWSGPRRAWLCLLMVGVVPGLVAVPDPVRATGTTGETGQIATPSNPGSGTSQVITDKPTYGPNEAVLASGAITFVGSCQSGGTRDYFQPFADIYVVEDAPLGGAALSDASGAPNVVWGGLAGGFIDQIIALTAPGGTLPGGTYGVAVDECQDGEFDVGEDTYIPAVFSVSVPSQLPQLSSLFAFGPLKSNAASQAARMKSAADHFRALIEIDTAREDLARINVFNPGELASAWFTKILEMSFLYLTGGADPKVAAQQALGSMARHWQGLANDPPDPDFMRPVTATAGTPVADPETSSTQRALERSSDEVRVDAALTEALVSALERYQGAVAVGNDAWALAHLRAAARLAGLLAARLPTTADNLDATVTAVDSGPSLNPVANDLRSHSGILLSNTWDSLPVTYKRGLMNLGGGRAELDTLRAFIADTDLAESTSVAGRLDAITQTADAARDLATDVADLAAALDQAARDAESVPGTEPDRPQADAGGPYSVAAGANLVLDATGSSPSGLDFEWDLDGDGDFSDASGAQPTVADFTVPGSTYLVALKVSNTAGDSAVDHAIVTVQDAAAPAATDILPSPRSAFLLVGESESFSLTTSATVEWVLDDAVVGAGTSYDYTATAGDVGSHSLVAHLTGPDGSAGRIRFVIGVVGADGDGDTWTAGPGPDCDDGNAAVYPTRTEITGNGIDDDCDPGTPDTGTKPSLVGLLTGALSTGAGYHPAEADVMSVSVSWGHPSRTSGQPFAWSMDWGDGTVETGVVQGTDFPSTDLNPLVSPHAYTQDGNYTARLCLSSPDGIPKCNEKPVWVGNMAPAVNGADLDDWVREDPYDGYVGPGPVFAPGEWSSRGGGLSYFQGVNQDYPTLMVSDEPGGYGRFRVDTSCEVVLCSDDDFLGLVLGYQPGEGSSTSADYVLVQWAGTHDGHRFGTDCGDRIDFEYVVGVRLARVLGVPMEEEWGAMDTFAIPDDPGRSDDDFAGCRDVQGLSEIARATNLSGAGSQYAWKTRVMHPSFLSATTHMGLYSIEVDYQPDSIKVWVDGSLEIEVGPPAGGGSWPPGRVAAYGRSQARARYVGYHDEPVFTTDEGSASPLSIPVGDGGTADTLSGQFTFGDGAPAAAASITPDGAAGPGWYDATSSHSWPDNGEYRGELCVSDDDDIGCSPYRVEVANVPPVVSAGRDRTTNGNVNLDDSSFSDPGTGDTHTATVDWGDGTPVETAVVDEAGGAGFVEADHAYSADGTHTVEVCVTDDDGASACDSFTTEVLFTNVAPVALVQSGVTGIEGSTVEIGVGFTDTNPGDTHSATVDWGDGTSAENVILQDGGGFGQGGATHTFVDNGTYTIAVEICDTSECNSTTTTAEITNAAPALELDPPTVNVAIVSLAGTYSDPGVADTHTLRTDWGDSSTSEDPASGGAFTAGHIYGADGTYDISVCIVDNGGDEGCAAAQVEISGVGSGNEPPVWAVIPDQSHPVGTGVSLDVSVYASDPDLDPLTFTGSGLPDSLSIDAAGLITGTLTTAGTYLVTVTADDGEAATETSFNWEVTPQPGGDSPRATKEDALARLEALLPTGSWWADLWIRHAIFQVNLSLTPRAWVDDHTLDRHWGTLVFVAEGLAVASLTCVWNVDGVDEIKATLAGVDEQLASDAISAAWDAGGNTRKLRRAEHKLEIGRWAAHHGWFVTAIAYYQAAWRLAQVAMP